MAAQATARRASQETAFARVFGLRDGKRNDFRLEPDADADLYVDLDNALDKVRRELASQAPKFVFEGDFGTGKSHALHHVARVLAPEHHFEPVYVHLSGFGRKSDFWALHPHLMKQLLPFAEEATRAPGDKAARLRDLPGLSGDMERAISALAFQSIGVPHADAVAAKQWLLGSRYLTAARAEKAGYAAALEEIAGPADLAHLYQAISELYRRAFQKRLLILLDEAEVFSRVVDVDAQASIGAGIRTLLDPTNELIGFFLGLNTPSVRMGIHPMLRSDVRSRLGDRIAHLLPLDEQRALRLMRELWSKLTLSTSRLPPFGLDEAAQHFVAKNMEDLRRAITQGEKLDPSPTPRDLLNILSTLGQSAIEVGAALPIGVDVVRKWFGLGSSR